MVDQGAHLLCPQDREGRTDEEDAGGRVLSFRAKAGRRRPLHGGRQGGLRPDGNANCEVLSRGRWTVCHVGRGGGRAGRQGQPVVPPHASPRQEELRPAAGAPPPVHHVEERPGPGGGPPGGVLHGPVPAGAAGRRHLDQLRHRRDTHRFGPEGEDEGRTARRLQAPVRPPRAGAGRGRVRGKDNVAHGRRGTVRGHHRHLRYGATGPGVRGGPAVYAQGPHLPAAVPRRP